MDDDNLQIDENRINSAIGLDEPQCETLFLALYQKAIWRWGGRSICAEHSGSGTWNFVFAAGAAAGSSDVPSRVKTQVDAGMKEFENVSVFAVPQ